MTLVYTFEITLVYTFEYKNKNILAPPGLFRHHTGAVTCTSDVELQLQACQVCGQYGMLML